MTLEKKNSVRESTTIASGGVSTSKTFLKKCLILRRKKLILNMI